MLFLPHCPSRRITNRRGKRSAPIIASRRRSIKPRMAGAPRPQVRNAPVPCRDRRGFASRRTRSGFRIGPERGCRAQADRKPMRTYLRETGPAATGPAPRDNIRRGFGRGIRRRMPNPRAADTGQAPAAGGGRTDIKLIRRIPGRAGRRRIRGGHPSANSALPVLPPENERGSRQSRYDPQARFRTDPIPYHPRTGMAEQTDWGQSHIISISCFQKLRRELCDGVPQNVGTGADGPENYPSFFRKSGSLMVY